MKTLLMLFVALLFSLPVAAQTKYSEYSNPQFGYSMEFPSNLYSVEETSMRPNGVKFTSPAAGAKMVVWARQTTKADIAGEYEIFLKSYSSVVQDKYVSGDSFLIKGKGKTASFQIKGMYRTWKGVNIFYVLNIEYPSDDEKFKRAADEIVSSFRLIAP